MPTAKWLSLGQAAAQSGGKVSVSTLRRYVAAGRVRGAIRTPGGWFKVPPDVVEQLVSEVELSGHPEVQAA